ncbi:MAG: Ni/Fe hydrogenase subunit alpha [Anaerolineales bacterium]|nr:Ni/Fe hydrogenase subunit alpha [Anaerolineales bacterium]
MSATKSTEIRSIEVPALARVEGEGGLYIGVKGGKINQIKVNIYEPPRFFEGFLRGRSLYEVPDITARICGICPVAYQMSSVNALEAAQGVKITPPIRALRRLLYCAEYIESHALHIYLLQAPDLLGQESAISLAEVAPEVVTKALRMKKVGNALLRVIGGRSVHPVSTTVGGFYRWPEKAALEALLPELEWSAQAAVDEVRWAAGLAYPEFEVDAEYVATRHPDEYGVLEGRVVSSTGLDIPPSEFDRHYLEEHVAHCNSLHSHTQAGNSYMVGPLARFNLNHGQLGKTSQSLIKELKIQFPIRNPFKALLARSFELVDAYEDAVRLIREYRPEGPSRILFDPKPGEGSGVSEAPRGLLFHKYTVGAGGLIEKARIVPPTSQNYARMEADLWKFAPTVIAKPHEEATLACEHLIRSYDPCISCSVHFVRWVNEDTV